MSKVVNEPELAVRNTKLPADACAPPRCPVPHDLVHFHEFCPFVRGVVPRLAIVTHVDEIENPSSTLCLTVFSPVAMGGSTGQRGVPRGRTAGHWEFRDQG